MCKDGCCEQAFAGLGALPISALYLKNQLDNGWQTQQQSKEQPELLQIKRLMEKLCAFTDCHDDQLINHCASIACKASKVMTYDDWEYVMEVLLDELSDQLLWT